MTKKSYENKIFILTYYLLLFLWEVQCDLTKTSVEVNINPAPIETSQILAQGSFIPISGINANGS